MVAGAVSISPQNWTSSTKDQSSLTGMGIMPRAHRSWVTGEVCGSTTSQILLISCGNAGWPMPTPSWDMGNPEVTDQIWMSGNAARNVS